jgi:hypothetical protein
MNGVGKTRLQRRATEAAVERHSASVFSYDGLILL